MNEQNKSYTYIDTTLCSCGLQEIPVQPHGDSSLSFQLLRTFLLSFKLAFTSNNVRPIAPEMEHQNTKLNKSTASYWINSAKILFFFHDFYKQMNTIPSGVRAREQSWKRDAAKATWNTKTKTPIFISRLQLESLY